MKKKFFVFLSLFVLFLLIHTNFFVKAVYSEDPSKKGISNSQKGLGKFKDLNKEISRGKISFLPRENEILLPEERNITNCPFNCTCSGVVVKCKSDDDKKMFVFAKSGNIITINIEKEGERAIKAVELNITKGAKAYYYNKSVYVSLKKPLKKEYSSNESIEEEIVKKINIFPDDVKKKIKPGIENESIKINEDGIYDIKGKKRARLFRFIKVLKTIEIQVDPESGEIIKYREPWWSILSKDAS